MSFQVIVTPSGESFVLVPLGANISLNLANLTIIAILVTPNPQIAGDEVEVFAAIVGDTLPDGMTLEWNFGDNSPPGDLLHDFHVYGEAGNYTITLTVTSDTLNGVWSTPVTITVRPLIASFVGTPLVGESPLQVQFTSTVADGTPPYTYSWDFGDSTTSTSANPLKTYTGAAVRTVVLTVTDSAGSQKVVTQPNYITITATADLEADFFGVPTSLTEGQSVTFDSTVTGGVSPYTYAWDFGDGVGTSALADPVYTYSTAGTYTVELVVTDSAGSPDTDTVTRTNYITVSVPEVEDDGVLYNIQSDDIFDFVLVGSDPGSHGLHVDHTPHPARFFGEVTIVAIDPNGDWNDPDTWDLGRVPIAGDGVHIPGKLRFAVNMNTRMTTNLLAINEDGILSINNTGDYLTEIVYPDVAINTVLDPYQWGHGFIGLGTLNVYGKTKTTWLRLAAEPVAGATTLTLSSAPTAWSAGDRLVIPDTRQLNWDTSNPNSNKHHSQAWVEEVVIQSIDGVTVTLTAPLVYTHTAIRDGDDVIDYYPAVGNLSRNIVVRSANVNGTKGHQASHGRAAIDIRYVEFRNTGRSRNDPFNDSNGTTPGTNQRARYGGWHFHHTTGPLGLAADVPQYRLEGCSIWNERGVGKPIPSRWGINTHGSSYGLVKSNVVYNVTGFGIGTEDGGEIEIDFDNNYVCFVPSSGTSENARGTTDIGHVGSGFWVINPRCRITNNYIATCGKGISIVPFMMTSPHAIRQPAYKGADMKSSTASEYVVVNGQKQPLLEFDGNELMGRFESGLDMWRVNFVGASSVPDAVESLLTNTVICHAMKGYYNYQTTQITFDNFTARNDFTLLKAGQGQSNFYFGSDYVAERFLIRDSDIQGFLTGWAPILGVEQAIENTYMRNYRNVEIHPQWWAGQDATAMTVTSRTITITGLTTDPVGMGNKSTYGTQGDIVAEGLQPTNNRVWNESVDLTAPDVINVVDYQGVSGDNFRLYYPQQLGSALFPCTRPRYTTLSFTIVRGCPNQGVSQVQSGATTTVLRGESTLSAVDDAYNGMAVFFIEGNNAHNPKVISDYVGATREFTLASPLSSVPVTGHRFVIDPRKTNTQSLADHGVCWGGVIAPEITTTRDRITGLVVDV